MAEIVRMPKLSDTMVEGVVAAWHKKVGDAVKEGELLAEIETDKATMEFESFFTGVLLHIGVEKGKAAPVNSVLAVIGKAGEDISSLLAGAGTTATAAATETKKPDPAPVKEAQPVAAVQPVAQPVTVAQPVAASHAVASNGNGRIFASPLAKKMAEEKGIDLSTVSGSGENNRITKKDIENYSPSAAKSGGVIYAAAAGTESYNDVPNSQMRKAIARTLSASKFSAPHFYLKMEVDMDNAIAAREAINAGGEYKISFNDMVIKAVASALRRHPKVNADWMGDFIRYNNHIHVGVAVAVDEGLVVPVVRFTDSKGFAQISAEIKDLATRAKSKKLQPQEMEGGTFAVSNLGMFGIEDFTSIINPPNGCILSVGQIKSTPVVKNGQIVPGNVMKLSLSCDHRVVDGAVGSAFLKTLKEILENPVKMLV
ncbi:MAG: pyruvate dehydrogenase complex dihydrolipoamide acetyltransferase [Crocinitomicaceae bacterium]|nr:pyruvate dehydrogenase complex dihydrolipoamide acetyltransferase [Crocinitomicaceae bacterium]